MGKKEMTMATTIPDSVEIGGVRYVREAAAGRDHYCIIRTSSAGVFAAELVEREGGEAKLAQARRLWYWEGAASLSQLALEGVSKPASCKFPAALPSLIVLGVIEVIPCTAAARKSIESVPVWSA